MSYGIYGVYHDIVFCFGCGSVLYDKYITKDITGMQLMLVSEQTALLFLRSFISPRLVLISLIIRLIANITRSSTINSGLFVTIYLLNVIAVMGSTLDR
jgi:hypothetical protein